MPASQTHIGPDTPMGATARPGGCTFRCWAPRALGVWVTGSFNGWSPRAEAQRLVRDPSGCWAGFVPGVGAGAQYKFYVDGPGSRGYKRDPHAREIVAPDWNCVVTDPAAYPWHDAGFRPPAYEDLIIYQLHVGTFFAVDAAGADRRQGRVATFLDAIDRIPYLAELGVTAVQPLPIVEFPTAFSLGYNGTDYFSPEFTYAVPEAELGPSLRRANALLAARGHAPVAAADIRDAAGQLRLFVDLLHVHGIAVLFDVVYNHAGGDFGDESLYFFDRVPQGNNNDSLYFTDRGWAGGLVFAYWNAPVRRFLIDNAVFLAREFHVDGLRYDEVSVIDAFGGWSFCQDLTAALRGAKPSAVQVAEYWAPDQAACVRPAAEGGAGFDLVWHAGLRESVRQALAQAAGGRDADVNLDPVAQALAAWNGLPQRWRAVQMLENHDVLLVAHEAKDRRPRVPAAADPSNARSWYARSRSRVATGLLLTGPGIPLLFMGQEFLEDKLWSDSPDDPDHRIWWDGLRQDRAMADFLRFTRELIGLRRAQPALTRGEINVFHVHNLNRVIAYHRWLPGQGRDVVVAASLAEATRHGYALGFPRGGTWREAFNSDVYDGWVNPAVAGNSGAIEAGGPPLHGLPHSAAVVLPANAVVVFVKEDP
ncbi:glycoside hydrolase family 13 domain protein [Methylobacterium sp. 4-46]|uniref:alpha amylase C-terminal domain-containing protein n=1 Tax=unclassified Methylobacterium TaxID=2615210 RepID=UPI000152E5F1|nr:MULTISPECIES: alpha amylase C-terminal domain-containing protein [Methylobacterium]ACA15655.1 glycoside hydrolase family 13 domain protein [Methylobacterium sp. 4-46]WFT81366.1 alpha amylase C-terminal domain-containing protein [Methylobacterium nodulans]